MFVTKYLHNNQDLMPTNVLQTECLTYLKVTFKNSIYYRRVEKSDTTYKGII